VRLALALAAALSCLAAHAQEKRPFPWELRADVSRDNLDHGYEDWREAVAQLSWRPDNRMAVFGGYRLTERYRQDDRELFGGAYLPLPGVTTQLHLEGSASPTHRVLAKNMGMAELIQPLGDGWVASFGGKQARYPNNTARSVWTGIEKYAGNFRYAYLLQIGRPDGAGWAPGHRVSASWYRGDLTFATLTLARGRELENVGGLVLLATDVRAASLAAGLELAPQWGLTFELAWTEQGELYTRRTARLGTRFLF
jgi:YaiO family outer membrane protein